MLRKLLKHDIKATSGFAFPMMGFIALAIVLTGIIISILLKYQMNMSVSTTLTLTATLLGIGALIANFVLLVMTLVRFYSNLMTDEGYLMHTLPVTATEHIVSKLLTVLMFGALLIIADVIAVGLASVAGALVSGANIGEVFKTIWDIITKVINFAVTTLRELKLEDVSTLIITIVEIIAGILFTIMLSYFAMSVAGMAKKAKFIAGIGIYFGVSQGVRILLASIITTVSQTQDPSFMVLVASQALIHLIGTVVFFFATRGMLTKHLNLN